jgi:quinoprotein glucose dehydrogenase
MRTMRASGSCRGVERSRLAVAAVVSGTLLSIVVCAAQTRNAGHRVSETKKANHKDWAVYEGGNENIKYSALDQITPANVKNLQVVWRYSSGEASDTNTTDMKTNPLIVDGTLYGLNPQLRLFALDAATGKAKWVYDPVHVPLNGKNIGRGDFVTSTKISRGLAFYTGSDTDRRIIYAPGGGHALYCINALTGKLITSFGDNGIVDLHDNLDWTPPANGLNLETAHDFHMSMTSPGIIYKDLIIVGSRLSEGPLTPPGHIRAFDVHTGKLRWIFHTIPYPGEPGYETYENKGAYKYVGAANAWGGFSLDEKRGIVFTGTGSPTPDFWGGNRRGDDLFGDCTLALDAATGKLIWYFQEVHHDLWDWDNPTAPILATITKDGKRVDVVVQTTKQGFIFMFDRVTGKPIHPIEEVPVPQTNLKGEYTSPTQPVPTFFKPFVRQVITEADLFKDGISAESYQDLLRRFRTLDHDNMWNPPSERGTIQNPGLNGGGEWGGPAFDPATEIMYINANESPWVIGPRTESHGQYTVAESRQTNLEAGRALYEKNCAGCHGPDRMGGRTNSSLGSNPSLVGLHFDEASFKSLIFTGRGTMPPFTHLGEGERTAIASYALDLKPRQKEIFVGSGQPELPEYYRNPYKEGRGGKFLTKEGYPGVKPPWGHLSAINLNTGQVVWKQTIGDYPELKAKGIHAGSENFGAPVVTAGGVVFIAATRDEKFRAFNKLTGELLWEADLSAAAGIATPAVYQVHGKEYVVIACGGGGKQRTKSGDQYVAFALPDNSDGKRNTVARR